jgi:hypothetical protein
LRSRYHGTCMERCSQLLFPPTLGDSYLVHLSPSHRSLPWHLLAFTRQGEPAYIGLRFYAFALTHLRGSSAIASRDILSTLAEQNTYKSMFPASIWLYHNHCVPYPLASCLSVSRPRGFPRDYYAWHCAGPFGVILHRKNALFCAAQSCTPR